MADAQKRPVKTLGTRVDRIRIRRGRRLGQFIRESGESFCDLSQDLQGRRQLEGIAVILRSRPARAGSTTGTRVGMDRHTALAERCRRLKRPPRHRGMGAVANGELLVGPRRFPGPLPRPCHRGMGSRGRRGREVWLRLCSRSIGSRNSWLSVALRGTAPTPHVRPRHRFPAVPRRGAARSRAAARNGDSH